MKKVKQLAWRRRQLRGAELQALQAVWVHEVQELNDLVCQKWDGVPRLAKWLASHSKDTPGFNPPPLSA